MKYTVDAKGYYGKFGGAFIPEMLYPNVEELRTRYLQIITEAGYQRDFQKLLKTMSAGQPLVFGKATVGNVQCENLPEA